MLCAAYVGYATEQGEAGQNHKIASVWGSTSLAVHPYTSSACCVTTELKEVKILHGDCHTYLHTPMPTCMSILNLRSQSPAS